MDNPNEPNSKKHFCYFKDPLSLTGAFRSTTMINVRYPLECPPPKPVILSKTQKPTQAPLSTQPENRAVSSAKQPASIKPGFSTAF